jgi:hypothetical protein
MALGGPPRSHENELPPRLFSHQCVEEEFLELRLETGFSEVHTILIDSLRVFSEKAAIVCLFGARRLSQHNLILSLPSPRKGASTRMYEGIARRVCTIFPHCAQRRQQGSLFHRSAWKANS